MLSARLVVLARGAGALTALPIAFASRAGVHLFAGELAEVIEAASQDARRYGEGAGLSHIRWVTAVLCNSMGRYEQALAIAQQASEGSPAQQFSIWGLVELIEAAARSGAPERAADALQLLSETTHASGTEWALGTEARSRALISDGAAAEKLYLEAIDRFGRSRLRVDLARARLVYGEWLRRQRRRRDARDQLGRAYEIFDSIGAAAFAERARIELRATGGHARQQPAVETPETLTAQEALIARLAGEGASNPEIAAQLFISRATVAYHLRKVFTKLGVTSRNQLAPALPARQGGRLSPRYPPPGQGGLRAESSSRACHCALPGEALPVGQDGKTERVRH